MIGYTIAGLLSVGAYSCGIALLDMLGIIEVTADRQFVIGLITLMLGILGLVLS